MNHVFSLLQVRMDVLKLLISGPAYALDPLQETPYIYRESETHTHTDTDRHIHRHTQTQTHTDTDTDIDRQTDTYREREISSNGPYRRAGKG